MLNIVARIQAALEAASPIRKLSDAQLASQIAALRPLQDLLEPKKPAPQAMPAPVASTAPVAPAAARAADLRSRPLYKGSIYSRRPAAIQPVALVVAPQAAPAVAPVAAQVDPELALVTAPMRAAVKLRLTLCEAEAAARARRRDGGRRPVRQVKEVTGRERTKASVAQDVLRDGYQGPIEGIVRATPGTAGNWVRLPAPGAPGAVQRGQGSIVTPPSTRLPGQGLCFRRPAGGTAE